MNKNTTNNTLILTSIDLHSIDILLKRNERLKAIKSIVEIIDLISKEEETSSENFLSTKKKAIELSIHILDLIPSKEFIDKFAYILKFLIKENALDENQYFKFAKKSIDFGLPELSVYCYNKILENNAGNSDIYRILGDIYNSSRMKNLDSALYYYEKYQELEPNNVSVWQALANITSFLGYFDKCIEYCEKILEKEPQNKAIIVLYFWSVSKMSNFTQEKIKESSEKFINNYIKATNLKKNAFDFSRVDKTPNRKLTIGYISSNFYNHVMNFFTTPIFQYHNRSQFKLICFKVQSQDDNVTENLKKYFDKFVDCSYMTDKEISKTIYKNKVDIMIDLNGYTTNTGLFSLIEKPAPIQCTYMDYPNTTGLDSIDYILSDKNTIKEDEFHLYTEQIVYLPKGYAVFSHPKEAFPEINESPFIKNGYVSFGAFHAPDRVTEEMMEVWAKILNRVENSKLLFHYLDRYTPEKQQKMRAFFKKYNIPGDRLVFYEKKENHYQKVYRSDICLDSYPYNGMTRTMVNMCLGIPTVAVEGYHSTSRPASRILRQVGLSELIGKNLDEYVDIAVNLANNPEKIKYYRNNIRNMFYNSEITDYKGFTEALEDTYRKLWCKYCETN